MPLKNITKRKALEGEGEGEGRGCSKVYISKLVEQPLNLTGSR